MDTENSLLEIFDYYGKQPNPSQQDNIIMMLREIQEILGCIPEGVQEQVAKVVNTKVSVIRLLIQRFPSLKSANYRHRIVVCSGQRCSTNRAGEILTILREELKPNKEGYSEDGNILLCVQNCLKQCKNGPNMLVDGVLYSQMDKQKAKQLLLSLKNN